MRSSDLWFRPIETRVGPDGALYVVDFYNQAVIHNDTRGPQHEPANAAVRPDRDHYFGRIWRVQHKQATKLAVPVLNRSGSPRSHPGDRDEPERPGQADGLAARAGELFLRCAPGADQEADGELGARTLRAGARRQNRAAAKGAARHVCAGHRQLDTFGDRRRGDRAALALRGQRLRVPRPQAWSDFVAVVAPAALPANAGSLLVSAAGAGPQASTLTATVVRAVARMEGGAITMGRGDDGRFAEVARRSRDDGGCASDRRAVGQGGRAQRERRASGRVLQREFGDPKTSDDRRAELAASLLATCPGAVRRRWPRSGRC